MKPQAVILLAMVTAMMLSPVTHASPPPSDDDVTARVEAALKKAGKKTADAKTADSKTSDTKTTDTKTTDVKKPADKTVTPPAAPAKPATSPSASTTKIPSSGSTVKTPAAKPAAAKPTATSEHKVEAPTATAAEHKPEAPKPAAATAPARTMTVINPASVKVYQQRIAKVEAAQAKNQAVTPKQKALVIWINKYRVDHHMVGQEHDRELWANEVFVHQVYEKLVEIDNEPPTVVATLPPRYPAPPRPPAVIPQPPRPADASAVTGISPDSLRAAQIRADRAEAAYHQCSVNCAAAAAAHNEAVRRLQEDNAQIQGALDDANQHIAALEAARHPHKKVVVADDDGDDDDYDRPVHHHRRAPLGLFGQPGGLLGMNNGLVNPALFGPNGNQNPMVAYQQQQALAAMQQQAFMQRQAMQYGLMNGRFMYPGQGGAFGAPPAVLPWGGGGYSPILGLNSGLNYGGLPTGSPIGYGGGFNMGGNRPPPVVPYQGIGGVGANYGGVGSPIFNTGGYSFGGTYGGTYAGTYGRTLPQVCVAPCPR